MKRAYYVQEIADNYLKNVVDDPVSMKVHARFLGGLDQEQFQGGFLSLADLK